MRQIVTLRIMKWLPAPVLSVLAALFLSLSFPPFPLAPLQIPAFLCLFELAKRPVAMRSFLGYSYVSFVLWNLFTTYWLMMAHVGAGVAAVFANAAIMLLPMVLIRYFVRKNWGVTASLMMAASWVSYEFLHHRWDLAWPWLSLGNAWSSFPSLVQYVSQTGILGISFWVVFSSALLYLWLSAGWERRGMRTGDLTGSSGLQSSGRFAGSLRFAGSGRFVGSRRFTGSGRIAGSGRRRRLQTVITFTPLLLFPAVSLFQFLTFNPPDSEPIHIAVVQPNSDSYQPLGGHPTLDHLTDHLLTLSEHARTDSTDLILWPENALDTSTAFGTRLTSRIADSTSSWNSALVTGTGYIKTYKETGLMPLLTRTSASGTPYNVYNAALFFRQDGMHSSYLKGRLVPFVERLPFADFLFRFDVFGWVDWQRFYGYGLGTEAVPFELSDGTRFPALICYDSVFPSWVSRFVQDGAGFISIITNDGWWGDSAGHVQHFEYAKLRALEHRQWVVRSANNGISGVIDPLGRVVQKTDYWTEDVFHQTIYKNEQPTFYARWGDWVGGLMLILVIAGRASGRFWR